MIENFADHAQALLVTYVRDVLKQPRAAEWFETWWTGDRGRYCLAHAGYGGSNSNMGVEVDWRDVAKLLPAWQRRRLSAPSLELSCSSSLTSATSTLTS